MSPLVTVINGGSAIANINGGGTGVDEFTYKDGVTLTSTELATLVDGVTFHKNIGVVFDMTGFTDATQLKRILAIASLYPST
jgi:hypothetical protein